MVEHACLENEWHIYEDKNNKVSTNHTTVMLGSLKKNSNARSYLYNIDQYVSYNDPVFSEQKLYPHDLLNKFDEYVRVVLIIYSVFQF